LQIRLLSNGRPFSPNWVGKWTIAKTPTSSPLLLRQWTEMRVNFDPFGLVFDFTGDRKPHRAAGMATTLWQTPQ
jgi:hypothetical protein